MRLLNLLLKIVWIEALKESLFWNIQQFEAMGVEGIYSELKHSAQHPAGAMDTGQMLWPVR